MRIAFYAPLKPPDHPVPSGDREIARALIEGLTGAGHQVVIASRLRALGSGTVDAGGDYFQAAMRAQRAGLIERYQRGPTTRPAVWLTYHVYHKAPDWLGPPIASALGIPYVIAEAAVSPKKANGCHAQGYRKARACVAAADGFIHLNPRDRECVAAAARGTAAHLDLPPFARLQPFLRAGERDQPAEPVAPGSPVRLITTAMMRHGDKLASFKLLAGAMGRCRDLAITLTIIGDGPARPAVELAFRAAGVADRIFFLGSQPRAAIPLLLRNGDIFVWPAINEAIGLAVLEAQAAGLPVVAGAAGAIGQIIADGVSGHLAAPGDPQAFAAMIRALVAAPELAIQMGRAGHAKARDHHDLPAAADRISQFLRQCAATHATTITASGPGGGIK